MARGAFALRRSAVHAGLLAALGAVALVVVGTVGVATALTDRAFDDGVAALVAQADPTARALQVDAPLDDDPAAQDDGVRAVVAEAFPRVAVGVARAVWATSRGGGWRLVADDGIAEHGELVDGAWPTADDEVALGEAAAGRAAASIGDAIDVDGATLQVVGVWRPLDAGATVWATEPEVSSGIVDGAAGPAVVTEAAIDGLSPALRARWTVGPAGAVSVAELGGYGAGASALRAAAPRLDPASTGLRIDGALDDTVARASAAVAAARAMLAVPLLLLVAIGALLAGLLTGALATARAEELRLLAARGASRVSLATTAGAEALAVTAVGGALGATIGILLGASPTAPLLVAVAIAVLSAGLGAAATAGATTLRPDRRRVGARGLLTALIAAAAATVLAVAQLATAGVVAAGRLDPLAAAAPALLLLTAALAVAALAAPLFGVAARTARRGRGLVGVLALRRLARRSGAVAAGVLALGLAAGATGFGASLAAAADTATTSGVAREIGADARARYEVPTLLELGVTAPDPGAVAAEPGVEAAAPALAVVGAVGPTDIAVVAVAPAGEPAAVAVPVSATVDGDLTALVTADGDGEVVVTVWLGDADGVPVRVELTAIPVDGDAHEASVPLPAGDVTLLGVDVVASGATGPVQVSVAATDASGSLLAGDATLAAGHRSTRLLPDDGTGADDPLPVAVSARLATALALEVGDALEVKVGAITRPIATRVAAIEPTLPGVDGAGLVADLGATVTALYRLGGSVLTPNEVWVSGDPAVAVEAVRRTATAPVVVDTVASVGVRPVLAPAIAATRAMLAAVAVVALAAFAAATAAGARRRRGDAVALQASGLSTGGRRSAAVAEVVLTVAYAGIVGALAGLAIAAALTAPLLAVLPGAAP